MSDEVIVMCPGQGAQAVGMGRAWCEVSDAARATFDEADDVLGGSLGAALSEICFTGPEERVTATDVAQPAIYTCSVAGRVHCSSSGRGFQLRRWSETRGPTRRVDAEGIKSGQERHGGPDRGR